MFVFEYVKSETLNVSPKCLTHIDGARTVDPNVGRDIYTPQQQHYGKMDCFTPASPVACMSVRSVAFERREENTYFFR